MQAKGNAAFSSGNFEEAIGHFTEAIELDSSNHVLYSNRSACQVSRYENSLALCMEVCKTTCLHWTCAAAANSISV